VSRLGGSTQNPTVDSQGNINVIEAALAKGVKKFILVTSIGCGDTKDAPGEQVGQGGGGGLGVYVCHTLCVREGALTGGWGRRATWACRLFIVITAHRDDQG